VGGAVCVWCGVWERVCVYLAPANIKLMFVTLDTSHSRGGAG